MPTDSSSQKWKRLPVTSSSGNSAGNAQKGRRKEAPNRGGNDPASNSGDFPDAADNVGAAPQAGGLSVWCPHSSSHIHSGKAGLSRKVAFHRRRKDCLVGKLAQSKRRRGSGSSSFSIFPRHPFGVGPGLPGSIIGVENV